MSQVDAIISYLKPPGRVIDPMKALRLFNCWALSSRISDIKKRKLPIQSKLVYNRKTKKQYATYFFK